MSSPIDDTHCSSIPEAFEPSPRQKPLPYRPIDWRVNRTICLPSLVEAPAADFAEVTTWRSSSREISRGSLREIANFLGCATRIRAAWGDSPVRSSRPAHSAGALHSTEIFLITGSQSLRVFRFAPLEQQLHAIDVKHPSAVKSLFSKVAAMVPAARGDLIVLLNDQELLDSQYENSSQLGWRDAGALMQVLHFFAAAHRIAFCPLGISGVELLRGLAPSRASVQAMGVAVVGREPDGLNVM